VVQSEDSPLSRKPVSTTLPPRPPPLRIGLPLHCLRIQRGFLNFGASSVGHPDGIFGHSATGEGFALLRFLGAEGDGRTGGEGNAIEHLCDTLILDTNQIGAVFSLPNPCTSPSPGGALSADHKRRFITWKTIGG
jgi:hypothetical protein